MPNLKGLGLQNFRTFQSKEYMEFAPITIITGANNAGKSSVIKAIQLLSESYSGGDIKEELDFKNMKHELGSIRRIYNNERYLSLKDKESILTEEVSDFDYLDERRNTAISEHESEDDLTFVLSGKLGGLTKKDIRIEISYQIILPDDEGDFYHKKKGISILYEDKIIAYSYIRWGSPGDAEEPPSWNFGVQIDLQKILNIIDIKENEVEVEKKERHILKTEQYLKMNFYEIIEKYGKPILFESSQYRSRKENSYKKFIDEFDLGKNLFGNYTELNEKDKKMMESIEQGVFEKLLKGFDSDHFLITDAFKQNWLEKNIETSKYIVDNELGIDVELRNFTLEKTTVNGNMYELLMEAVHKDLTDSLTKSCRRLNNIYYLPTSRGKGRDWFIDEQGDSWVELMKEFTQTYGLFHKSNETDTFVNFWIGKGEVEINGKIVEKGIGIGEKIEIERQEEIGLTRIFIRNFNGTKTPLVDLGYGVSQFLPIIMKIVVIANKNQDYYEAYTNSGEPEFYGIPDRIYYNTPTTLLIEEPEANLHPALQSKLAEMLIDAGTRFNIQFIIETHSEYLIYKMQEYVGNKTIRPNDIALYYLNHPETVKSNSDKKYVNRVPIGEDGSIEYEKYFGTGFFDEQTDLKLSLLNIQRKHFVESFQQIREKFKTSTGLTEDEQFRVLTESIDKHFEKLDFSTHINRVKSDFPAHSIFQAKTKEFLASAYHLMEIYGDNSSITEYSAAVIQFGRAIECELTYLMDEAKKHLIQLTDFDDWCSNFKADAVIFKSKEKHELKNFLKGKKDKGISFGNIKNILNLLKAEDETDLKNVALFRAFWEFLENDFFDNWLNVLNAIPNMTDVVDGRNNAAHTYGKSVSPLEAIQYRLTIENFLRVWTTERKA